MFLCFVLHRGGGSSTFLQVRKVVWVTHRAVRRFERYLGSI
jgi:hypothetical protein